MTEPDVFTQELNDTSIKYLHYAGDGPTLIMLHATGFSPWLFHPIARELSGEYRIIAPFLSHHRNAPPEEGISWQVLADDLYQLCRKLNIEKPLLVGHSMGGTIITLAEACHGPLAGKIILIEPIYLPPWLYEVKVSPEQHPLAGKALQRKNYWKDTTEARNYLYSRSFFKSWDEEVLELYISRCMIAGENGGLTLDCHPRTEAALFMGGLKRNPWPLLPEVSCPVLIIEGGQSENKSEIDLSKAASLFPHAYYYQVDEAGHLIPMEHPAVITEFIRSFLQKESL